MTLVDDILSWRTTTNYEERKVDRYEKDDLLVDTCSCTDGNHEYETAILHPEYGDNWVIVEAYDSREQAQAGHDKWVKTMTMEPLPEVLTDCQNSRISQLCSDLTFPRSTRKEATA